MPLVRDSAVCLRVSPWSETSQIVTLLTREHGRVRLVAKGATRRTKAGKSKFDGGLDLLDGGDAVFSLVLERDLSLLTEWSQRDGHRDLRSDVRAMFLGLYAAELLDRLLEEHDPHPRLFDQFERLLSRLADASVREAVALAFVLNLLRGLGVLPDFGRCAGGRTPELASRLAFSPRLGALLCDEEADRATGALPVSREALASIVALLRLARAGGELPQLTRAQADAAHRLLIAHVQEQIGSRLRTARYVVGA